MANVRSSRSPHDLSASTPPAPQTSALSSARDSSNAAFPGALRRTLAFIRFSHTIFALPFALGSGLVAANGLPKFPLLALIILAMVFARTAAMTFNRIADWQIDQRNPRTAGRHKLISRRAALALLASSAVAFIITTYYINPLCFALSPVALAIVFFYSFTKRFTSFSHFFLGLALAVSPVGAWLAVTGTFAWPPLILAGAVLVWVAGFDLIYATQDAEFDAKTGLHSLVVKLGVPRALKVARILHFAAFVMLAVFGWSANLNYAYAIGLCVIAFALIYEHNVVRETAIEKPDLAKINSAFFNSNAIVSAVFLISVGLDILLRRIAVG